MTNYEKFVQFLKEKGIENPEQISEWIWETVEELDCYNINEKVKFFDIEGLILQGNPETTYDSYGINTDLEIVVGFPDFGDLIVLFSGNRASYQGTEWYSMREVKPKQVTTTIYE